MLYSQILNLDTKLPFVSLYLHVTPFYRNFTLLVSLLKDF